MVMRQGELTSCINLFCMHAFDTLPSYKKMKKWGEKKRVIPPGIEPGTLSVLDSRDNHYTMESSVAFVRCEIRYTRSLIVRCAFIVVV